MTSPEPVVVNEAEAIVEPFWDPKLSGLKQWFLAPGGAHGLQVRQNWCWVSFEWARPPDRGPALRMERTVRIPCADYNRLVLSIMPPDPSVVEIRLETDRGPVLHRHRHRDGKKAEIGVPLKGARFIRRIRLEVFAAATGLGAGWINWIGLQHAARLRRYQSAWTFTPARTAPRLQPETGAPAWTGGGLLADPDVWRRLRLRHARYVFKNGTSPLLEAARPYRDGDPEAGIGEYVNFWGDTRYCRNRDFGRQLLHPGPSGALSVAAFLTRDPALQRLAARHALSIGLCGHWDDGLICRFPGSDFEHRSFVQSLCAHEVALALDLCGERMTAQARDFLRRRLAEEGLGAITYNTWAHDYIHNCNQLAWFSPGRMAALAVLDQPWPRTRTYMDLAYRELAESVEKTVMADGGYGEGPTYFRCVGRDGGIALYYYARCRKQDFASIVPEAFRRAAAFGALVESTVPGDDLIPICDAGTQAECDLLAVMALASPRSRWHAMLRRKLARQGGMADSILALILQESIRGEPAEPAPLVRMPVMGPVASHRFLGREPVKLLIMGHCGGVGHTHEDKGSFVLEFAGDTFAMDPGTCDYSHPLARQLVYAQRHNMLIPEGEGGRPAPRNPMPVDVKPEAEGDRVRFAARLDATPGWDGLFRKWVRTWVSPEPGWLAITDEYALAPGRTGAAFHWHTRLPVSLEGGRAVIRGRRGRADIAVPAGCAACLEELPLLDGTVQRRLVFRKKEQSGSILVEVRLVPG